MNELHSQTKKKSVHTTTAIFSTNLKSSVMDNESKSPVQPPKSLQQMLQPIRKRFSIGHYISHNNYSFAVSSMSPIVQVR